MIGGSTSLPILDAANAGARDQLLSRSSVRTLRGGDVVWNDGAVNAVSFVFLREGCVKLTKLHASGRETILQLIGPGELICSAAITIGKPMCCRATVASPRAEIVLVPREALLELGAREVDVARALLDASAQRTVSLCQRLVEVSSGRTEQRIARFFLRIAEQLGKPSSTVEGGVEIRIRLSRQDLADLLGMTVETAIRIMRRFGHEDLVRTQRAGFTITSVGRLAAICERPSTPPA